MICVYIGGEHDDGPQKSCKAESYVPWASRKINYFEL